MFRFPLAAPILGYPSVRSTLYRHRQLGQPPIPHSLAELSATLNEGRWSHLKKIHEEGNEGYEGRDFFRGLIGGDAEGWSAAVYISPRLQDTLRNTSRLHMDATFKVLPYELQAYQLLTVHAEYMNQVSFNRYHILFSKYDLFKSVEVGP